MKILFLNGSPRKKGFTAGIMKCIEEGIGQKHNIEWIHACDLTVKPCQGCSQCRPDGECILPGDDGHRVSNLIRTADALVIGSPTYFGNMTGALKTVIDRSVTGFEEISKSGLVAPIPHHKGKKAAMVTTCNSSEPYSQLQSQSKGTLLAMETVLKAGGYDVVGSIVLDGAAAREGIPDEVREAARKLGELLLQG